MSRIGFKVGPCGLDMEVSLVWSQTGSEPEQRKEHRHIAHANSCSRVFDHFYYKLFMCMCVFMFVYECMHTQKGLSLLFLHLSF